VSIALARVVQDAKLEDPTLKFVLMTVVLHAKAGGDPPVCYPGVARLMWLTGFSRATVKRSVEDLKAMGILEPVDVGPTTGRGHVKGYVIRVDQLPRRRPWAEERKGFLEQHFRPKRGSQKTPFKDERRRGKGAHADTKGAHSDHKRGSLAIQKGLTQSREVDHRSRSSELEIEEGHRVEAFVEFWNAQTRPPLPRCRELTRNRRRQIQARLTERPLTEWQVVMQRIQSSAFCTGRNERGWVASFDWLIGSPDVAVKVLEGRYDDRRANPRHESAITPHERARAERVRQSWGRCRHEEECASAQACVALIVKEWRAQEREVMQA
jgi:hypothetical protein